MTVEEIVSNGVCLFYNDFVEYYHVPDHNKHYKIDLGGYPGLLYHIQEVQKEDIPCS